MADEVAKAPAPIEELVDPTPTPAGRRRWRKALGLVVLGLSGVLLLAWITINSAIGHRLIADQIARIAPASGLKIGIGRIDGSLTSSSTLHDVTLADSQGVFLRVPLVELDWRPLHWFNSGLDVRSLDAHGGVLSRMPKLRPGNPNSPLLPNYDIRIDRLVIDNLTVPAGVLGPVRRIDLVGKVDIRKGRAFLRTDARLGGKDHLFALIDAAPAQNRFDLKLDYMAPRGGLLAVLSGLDRDLRARIGGKGTWQHWNGALLADQGGQQLAALKLTNRAGTYDILGLVHPDGLLSGITRRATGDTLALGAQGTLMNSVLKGRLGAQGTGLRLDAQGAVDLANNSFDNVAVQSRLLDPGLLGSGVRADNAQLAATLNGPFRALVAQHRLTVERLAFGTTRIDRLTSTGPVRYDGTRWLVPLQLTATRLTTGNALIDPRLVNATASGHLALFGNHLSSDDLALALPGLAARVALRGDLASGSYGLAGLVTARGFKLPNLGTADATARIMAQFGDAPWTLRATFDGRMTRVDNATLTSLAGQNIRAVGTVSLGGNRPLLLDNAALSGSKLALGLSGRRLPNGTVTINGQGRHADYGPFTVQADVSGQGPHAVLVFADPLPAAGLKQVRVALSPIPQGFRIETAGESSLGPFKGVLGLFSSPGGPTRIAVERLAVWKTAVTGSLLLQSAGITGDLALNGGGIDGTVKLAPRTGGQGFDVALSANDAHFGGATPLVISSAKLTATGLLRGGHSTISGNLFGQGIAQGNLFLGRIAANAALNDGAGLVTASLAGRRGSRFNLQLRANVAPNSYAVLAQGDFAGQRIAMPRRAVFTAEQGGWRLAPSQIDFGGGRAIASGIFATRATEINLALADMPLSLADIFVADVGLGGKASGLVSYRRNQGAAPTGSARLQIKGLTRSGLVLTSRQVDLALVANLAPNVLETRAVVREGADIRGRLQGRISGLPASGSLIERLRVGSLFAQLRYSGPADALWRLVALEVFDLTGPIDAAADVTGSLDNPQIRGSLASDSLRVQSALTGTDIRQVAIRSYFAGSRLQISSFSGRAANGGTVSGSGSVDLAGTSEHGPMLDLRIAANNAHLLARDDIAAAVTGPLRIVSDGTTGTIAGRVSLQTARWQLGKAAGASALPEIRTREINRRADIAPPRSTGAAWRYLIDASGANRIAVRGLGLDSEWGADIKLRGTTDAPTILGRADLVRGGYEFAGKRFELTRGRITFDGNSPPDPRLDIAAEAEVTGLTARVTVTGTSLKPDIEFSSTPALPQEELLSRLLFGNSITQISAPEALQLGAALASLRGGGGLDPINKLRAAIGLDRLRIVGADAALGRGTGVAVGKYLGRRFYAEIVTDGRGYSATELEFRITRWLSLLASVSTVGRESLNAKVSKDY